MSVGWICSFLHTDLHLAVALPLRMDLLVGGELNILAHAAQATGIRITPSLSVGRRSRGIRGCSLVSPEPEDGAILASSGVVVVRVVGMAAGLVQLKHTQGLGLPDGTRVPGDVG